MSKFMNKYLILVILQAFLFGCSNTPEEVTLLTNDSSKSWRTKIQYNIVLGDTLFVDQYEYQITTFNEDGTWEIENKLKTGELESRQGTWVIYPDEKKFSFVHPDDTLTSHKEFIPEMSIIELSESTFILAVVDRNGNNEYYLEFGEIKD